MGQDYAHAIDRLAALLDDEAMGRSFDPNDAIALAHQVAHIIPEMSPYMLRIIERMRGRQQRALSA